MMENVNYSEQGSEGSSITETGREKTTEEISFLALLPSSSRDHALDEIFSPLDIKGPVSPLLNVETRSAHDISGSVGLQPPLRLCGEKDPLQKGQI